MALQRPTFATTSLREGYDIGEVDRLVDRIFDDLAGPTPTLTAGEVRDIRFTPTRLRTGYDMGEVDDWLDEVSLELDRRQGEGSPAPVPAPQADGEGVAPSPQAPTVSTRSDAIVEVGGGATRWLLVLAVFAVLVVLAYVAYA